jgi:hypothetical protein
MLQDEAWRARMRCVLSGALQLWGVAGSVRPDGDALVIACGAGPELRVSRGPDGSWEVALHHERSSHPGLTGLLRDLRDRLAPGAPGGRLMIGAQTLHLGPPGAQ